MFYNWQKKFLENGASAFNKRRGPKPCAGKKKIEHLERKLVDRDEELPS